MLLQTRAHKVNTMQCLHIAGGRLSWSRLITSYFKLKDIDRNSARAWRPLLHEFHALGLAAEADAAGTKRWRAVLSSGLDKAIKRWRNSNKTGRVDHSLSLDWVAFVPTARHGIA